MSKISKNGEERYNGTAPNYLIKQQKMIFDEYMRRK